MTLHSRRPFSSSVSQFQSLPVFVSPCLLAGVIHVFLALPLSSSMLASWKPEDSARQVQEDAPSCRTLLRRSTEPVHCHQSDTHKKRRCTEYRCTSGNKSVDMGISSNESNCTTLSSVPKRVYKLEGAPMLSTRNYSSHRLCNAGADTAHRKFV